MIKVTTKSYGLAWNRFVEDISQYTDELSNEIYGGPATYVFWNKDQTKSQIDTFVTLETYNVHTERAVVLDSSNLHSGTDCFNLSGDISDSFKKYSKKSNKLEIDFYDPHKQIIGTVVIGDSKTGLEIVGFDSIAHYSYEEPRVYTTSREKLARVQELTSRRLK